MRSERRHTAKRAYDRLAGMGDKVNIIFADYATLSPASARPYNRRLRYRAFAAFDHPSLLLSAGRSLSLHGLPAILTRMQRWHTLSAMALAVTSPPNTLAQPPMPTSAVMIESGERTVAPLADLQQRD